MTKNLVVLRMANSEILLVCIIGSQEYKSTIIERIKFTGEPEDRMTRNLWLSHLHNCYLEGTLRGAMRVRDMKGECLLLVPSTSQIQE